MKLALAAVVGAMVLCGVLSGCCSRQAVGTDSEKYPDFMKISPGSEGIGTVRIRLVAADPSAVTYWRNYTQTYSKEVVASLGLVEVGRAEFNPGDTGVLETKLPPGTYWIKLRGYSVNMKTDEAGEPKKTRTLDRETAIPVTVRKNRTTNAAVDYCCVGYPMFSAL